MSAVSSYAGPERLLATPGARRGSLAILVADLGALLSAVFFAGALANLIRTALRLEPLEIANPKYVDHTLISLSLGGAMIVWLAARKHYSTRQTFSNQTKDIFVGCAAALLATAFLDFASKTDMARLSVFLTWGMAALLMIASRHLTMNALMARGAWFTPVLLLGGESRAAHFAKITRAHPELGFKVASTTNIDELLQTLRGLPEAHRRRALAGIMSRWSAESFLIAPSKADYCQALELVEMFERQRAPFVFAPETGALAVENLMLQPLAPFDGLMLTPLDSLDRPAARAAKALAEQAAAGLALLLLGPVFMALAIMICRDGGPAFFRQERIGRNGRRFFCLKFRSMASDAEDRLAALLREDPAAAAEWARNQKLAIDPRVTPVGRFLRRTSLDELPQLINVVCGDMSLVGPRPVVPGEIERYGENAEYYYRVRPGITGLWQVNGRNETTYEERVRLDSFYVRNWTLWRDLCIACRTVPEMLWKRSGL